MTALGMGTHNRKKLGIVFAAAMVMISLQAWGQGPSPARPGNTATHKQPCWQQAGVNHSALEQRRQVAETARSQIESVCSNSSLTAQQKQAQIRQIREQAHARMNSLVSSSQMQEIKSCRQQRGIGLHNITSHASSPCGEMFGNNKVDTAAHGATQQNLQSKAPAANANNEEEPDDF